MHAGKFDDAAITEAVITEMRGSGGRTIPDVVSLFARHGVAVDGENAMMFGENIVAWYGLSDDAVAALNALIADDRAEVVPSSEAAYQAAGFEGPFPAIGPAGISGRYDSPRWLPTEIIVRR
ncbi:hypothetical protein EV379_1638 [Microterricola gilva]|uniref:Uncharacterized protein n=1 Tax=Microterricola gilva TaxID=393267 RepID=A0A4Q8AMZ4_9MICO|nr:hypothetical protein [Microterricola gilva]RZU65309.1 hypothetical protein EV379_1638 [Microterricola gilva]